jgi:sec-independent protein translocase protein TatB
MIEFSWGHILVIAVVALIVIGPKELPTVLRTAGQWMGKIRRMAAEFQGQFQEALREAEMADVKQQFDDIGTAAKDLRHFDPIGSVRKELEGVMAEKQSPKVETAPLPVDTPPPAITGPAEGSQAEHTDNPVQPAEHTDNPVQASEEERGGGPDKAEGRLS